MNANLQNNEHYKDLQSRLINVVEGTCNKLGCDNCDLKWDGGCSATELEGKIIDIEIEAANEQA
ncbi:conserved hypothetical protein [Vibrio chagasii]|nr:conserved hypothetical protein [Vibrio chagasii]CAH6903756.1 conserved hypothetical protein [Vibrio chagasii]CAH6972632.1 conserved hypothetical protein [Vibrio chagasii]CAH7389169.1 conserved hypothetical protein [Vibrio chagasii]